MRAMAEVLSGRSGNAILPFMWVHGETEEQLRAGVERIAASGIGAVCVEARPHPDFVGAQWWHDLDVILDEAKKQGMRVWILDDAHFPTGYLNGRLSEFPQARKLLVDHYGIDVVGPAPGSAFMIHLEAEERFLGAVACRRDRSDPNQLLEVMDITGCAAEDTLFWDVPEGLWCVMILKATYRGHDRQTHINLLDREVVRLLLDVCYEPHYAHYQHEFGKTIAGFFSDEPQVGNASARVVGIARMGNKAMPLSWTMEIEERLRENWQDSFLPMLVACWYQVDGLSPAARLGYMNEVSRSFRVNFSEQVGDWCRARGVEYIGHVIEDNGSHMRLGHGPAHFFRALWGQDMAGIDVVLQQIRPGVEDGECRKISGREYYDGRFFHNLLAKLGTSLGHMDAKKKGRTLCEIFGAYGWSEGLKMMKWLADHMLVRGVNVFVPHAFTLSAFPDPDCPPHFYADGNNPQYPYFKHLMAYMNRVSHLIQGGRHVPCVALLYSAEGEWMDADSAQPLEEVCLTLNRAQIDYEIVPGDVLAEAPIRAGHFTVGQEEVGALIVSGRHYMSAPLCAWCRRAAAAGVPVLLLDGEPEQVDPADGSISPAALGGKIVSLTDLPDALRTLSLAEIVCDCPQPYLRYYHYVHEDGELILFFNEDPVHGIDCWLHTPLGSQAHWYDPWRNELQAAEARGGQVHLRLSPYQMLILSTGTEGNLRQALHGNVRRQPLEGEWQLTLIPAGQKDAQTVQQLPRLTNLCAPGLYPHFSGTMIYRRDVALDAGITRLELDLGQVFETAQVFLNGAEVGVCIAPPYVFPIDGTMVHEGANRLEIRVVNTLGNQMRDSFSLSLPMEPTGLLGPVTLAIEHE
ncbi:MAG: glycosylhydrolase-like jelly roll fold domain-containing protein [Aristaeellaceae bacterium]